MDEFKGDETRFKDLTCYNIPTDTQKPLHINQFRVLTDQFGRMVYMIDELAMICTWALQRPNFDADMNIEYTCYTIKNGPNEIWRRDIKIPKFDITDTATLNVTSGLYCDPAVKVHFKIAKGSSYGGGKSVDKETGEHIGFKFRLSCDADKRQFLMIDFAMDNRRYRFTLDKLTHVDCADVPLINEGFPFAGFDTYIEHGKGKLNGKSGYTIVFMFQDAGEPGGEDIASFTILDPVKGIILDSRRDLSSGNIQTDPRT